MLPIYEQHSVRGSIPVKQIELGPVVNGRVQSKPAIAYERTDRVAVQTGSDRNLTGGSYTVQKGSNGWKIIGKSAWIH
jgi:hypothetical protein